jgi:2'-5' RNA ligase
MRLFVAFDVDTETRRQLALARGAIQAIVDQARVPPRITWVKDEAAHVTVRFIGETPEERLRTIQTALESIRINPFDVTWETIGVFGGTRHPRAIWVAPTRGTEPLTSVAAEIAALLDPLIGAAEARPFKPHLTVGRIRESGRGVNWPGALEAARFNATVTHIDHVMLYESRLSPKGPTYTAISSYG